MPPSAIEDRSSNLPAPLEESGLGSHASHRSAGSGCPEPVEGQRVGLTVLTTALAAVEELGSVPGVRLFCTGGQFRSENPDFVGPTAVAAFAGLHADIAFVGADSLIVGRGLYSADQGSAAILSAIGACASRRVAVLDHTKINAQGMFLGLPRERIDCVITDAGLSPEVRREMEADGLKVILAAVS